MSNIGVIYAICPNCNDKVPVTVSAESGGVADNGVWQVIIVSDKTEVELHSIYCQNELV